MSFALVPSHRPAAESRGTYQILVSENGDDSLACLPDTILQHIVQFFSVKDRFSFKETCKRGQIAGSFVEIALLQKAFFKDGDYLARILKPLDINHFSFAYDR